jgi:Domain of unknown function (DUF4845)
MMMTKQQRGVTLVGLMFWAVVIGAVSLVVMKTIPVVNEYLTIQRAVDKIARSGVSTVPEIRSAFDKQKDIEYSIQHLSGKDLKISKENEKIVIAFAYSAEVELISPLFLLFKYDGHSK